MKFQPRDLTQEDLEIIEKFFSNWCIAGIIVYVYTPKGIGRTIEAIFKKRDKPSKAKLHKTKTGHRLKDTRHKLQVWSADKWSMGVKTKIKEGHLVIPPG